MPNLQVIVGSTRPGRRGLSIGQWFVDAAATHGFFDVELVDLAAVNLPLYDEAHHPRSGQYEMAHTKAWSETVARGDTYAFVVPEYNYGFNAATKNAIDFLHAEWADKPVGFVSYGGLAGGTRAVQALKQVVTALRMIPVVESVNVPFVDRHIAADGTFTQNEVVTAAATSMLDELSRWAPASELLRTRGATASGWAPRS